MMKKRKWIIPAIVAGVILVLLIAAVCIICSRGFMEGYYLEAKGGMPMIIVDNSPIVMSDKTERDLFAGLKTGDKISVLHDGILESYPARTAVYAMIKLRGGDADNIPSEVINSLMSMGWLDGGFEAKYTEPQKGFPILVAYAGWTDNGEIYARALNTQKMSQSAREHLPIYRLDTLANVEAFRSTFENDLAFEYGFDEKKSFNDAIEVYEDEAFLQSHSFMLVYVKVNSGTYRYGVDSILCDGESFAVNVEEVKHPQEVTADLAGWYIIVVVPDAMIDGCTEFDAVLVH